jgi:hypothetical protein
MTPEEIARELVNSEDVKDNFDAPTRIWLNEIVKGIIEDRDLEIVEMKEIESLDKLRELRERIVISGDRFLSKVGVLEILDSYIHDKK